jgi:serine protease AprX
MNSSLIHNCSRRKAVWGPKRTASALLLAFACLAPSTAVAKPHHHSHEGAKNNPGVRSERIEDYKIDAELTERSKGKYAVNTTRVIMTFAPGVKLPAEFRQYVPVGEGNNPLDLINGQVLDLPNRMLKTLAKNPSVLRVYYDRPIQTYNYRTAITVGARTVQQSLGYSGAGVGVAVIDSGISPWHDDLTNTSTKVFPYGDQRVQKFIDFVHGRTTPYDDNGHGTHVSGIIAGNGYDSYGEKTGIAPGANIISLKVIDENGQGTISSIIAALSWVATNATTYNIKVVNMSVGAGIYESYWTDPLTLATKKITDKGITVVAAAGNMGKNAAGHLQFGGITAPGNAPWVLTVGASSTMGTLTRADDTMAGYSSSGPTRIDFEAKPDLVAPGTGTVSLAAPGSTLFAEKAQYLLAGSKPTGSKPYLTLSGTSMAAPVVSGTIALMLQANPNLTPNLIKAILQYTSQVYQGYDTLRQGAGFLNSLGAVRLAKYYYKPRRGDVMPVQKIWSRTINWGSHRLTNGIITPSANAWGPNIVWGTAKTLGMIGDNIVWGTSIGDNIVWGTSMIGDNIVWGTSIGDNIVWGTSMIGDNIVWGTSIGDNIVWGTDCAGADCDNVVWGAADSDNIIWGTAEIGDNIVWGTGNGDNIVWGTSADADVTWGSDTSDAVVYSDEVVEPLPNLNLEFGDAVPMAPMVKPIVVVTTITPVSF